MNEFQIEKLDKQLDALLGRHEPVQPNDPELRELMQMARELALLPNPAFRADLRAALERRPGRPGAAEGSGALNRAHRETVIPPVFASGSLTFPMSGSRLALSFGLHVIALALIGTSGWWVVENRQAVKMKVAELVPVTDDYLLPVAPGKIGGGGGGGDQDKMEASHGTPPRFTAQQLTPPLVVLRNQNPALPAEPTLVGPPDIVLPQSDKLGDPMANILNPPSNGTGSGGGIGSGEGGGIGSGRGPGIGEGYGGGIGGGVFRVGGGVSAPRPLYDPDPEYSDEAR